jgi:hypothetical protein
MKLKRRRSSPSRGRAKEAGLQRRGDLTVWISDAALDAWRAPASSKPRPVLKLSLMPSRESAAG